MGNTPTLILALILLVPTGALAGEVTLTCTGTRTTLFTSRSESRSVTEHIQVDVDRRTIRGEMFNFPMKITRLRGDDIVFHADTDNAKGLNKAPTDAFGTGNNFGQITRTTGEAEIYTTTKYYRVPGEKHFTYDSYVFKMNCKRREPLF